MRLALRPSALKDWQGKPAQSMSHVGISLFFKSLKSGKITFGEKLRRIICWTCLLLSQAAAWTWGARKFSYPWITASMPLHNVTTRSNKRSASEALGGGVATRGRVRRRDSSSRSAVSLLRRTRVADATSVAGVPAGAMYISRSMAAPMARLAFARAAWTAMPRTKNPEGEGLPR